MLELRRETLPPFVQIERIPVNTPEYDELPTYSYFLDSGRGEISQILQGFNDIWDFALSEFLGDVTSNPDRLVMGDLKRLDVPLLREAVESTIAANSIDLQDEVRTAYVIHPPELKAKVIQTLSKLPFADIDGDRRLLSARNGNRVCVFPIESYQMELPVHCVGGPNWLIVILSNPDDPEIVLRVPEPGPWAESDFRLTPQETEKIELRVMETIESDLLDKGLNVEYVHEPNGSGTFPDFEVSIEDTEWSLEVTRVLGAVLKERIINLDGKDPKAMKAKALHSPPIDTKEVDFALQKALTSKQSSASKCKAGTKYCLVLVNVADLDIGKDSEVWTGKDLSAFGAVIMVHNGPRSNHTVEYIKGCLTTEGY